MIKFECKHDIQVFSWWIEQIWEVLVIFNFWGKSHTPALAESSNWLILKFIFIHFKAVKEIQNDQIQM